MPPEKSWTKHHDLALYADYALKPRHGQGPGFRVKLPGRKERVIRASSRHNPAGMSSSNDQQPTVRAPSTVAPSEDGDRAFVVRIPGVAKTPSEPIPVAVPPPASTTNVAPVVDSTADLSIEEVFTVRPNGAPVHIPIVAAEATAPSVPEPQITTPSVAPSPPQQSPTVHVSHLPEPHAQQQLEQIVVSSPADAAVNAQIEETVLRKGPPGIHAPVPQGPTEFRPLQPVLHPIQTSFSPVPQPSPPYGSPYAYGPMPPGVAMSQHGYPYEVATGRAVYLQPNPPPAMYTPRPMMHASMGHHHSNSITFIPGHMHHSSVASVSPDFLSPHSHPQTPPVNGFIDPMTGLPLFTPARQSSRIEIRAPGEGKQKVPPRPSGLRTTVSGSDVSSQSNGDVSSFFADSEESLTSQEGHHDSHDSVPGVDEYLQSRSSQGPAEPMPYPSYQQQYYYPEHYGYQPYVDPSQVVQYDMYRPDPHVPHQPIIYY
ncbi:hypothetical protein EUX98_g5400 [Antrodiella citrinella]|uniref:Uncharacterized protein n=1 Tax=Antrodiella citrinella TaxID=2447956 RepID=A0A4S4MRJ3_9APHY|nr:hypothetical protein EUX98_g5400 [Antrodiella citrinella]